MKNRHDGPALPELLTIGQLASYVGQDYDTIARKARLGLIPAECIALIPTATGRRPRKRFRRAAIDRWLQGAA